MERSRDESEASMARGPNQNADPGVVRLGRSGSTAILTVPKPFLRALRWSIGDHVSIHIDDGRLVISSHQKHVIAAASVPVAGSRNV